VVGAVPVGPVAAEPADPLVVVVEVAAAETGIAAVKVGIARRAIVRAGADRALAAAVARRVEIGTRRRGPRRRHPQL
jgi:hypothetical protein